MGGWQDLFVGRERELDELRQCWAKVQSGVPQLAVVLAPPGMGKTRLVQEFYHYVSQMHDGAGDSGYWPDRLGRERDRFALSCQAGECNPSNAMTMLWWAIKCVDNGHNSAASSDLLLAYKQFLQPHLEVRRTDEQLALLRKEQLKEGAKGLGEFGIAGAEKAAELIPVIGPFIGLAKAIGTTIVDKSLRVRKLEVERNRLEAERQDLAGKAASIQEDLEEQLMGALGNFAKPRSGDIPACPMIIVIDDAQFADQDPALQSFLRRFIDTAWAESWPVLIVMTHWTYEWNLHADDIGRFSGLIQASTARGLMEASIIPLGKLEELRAVLQAAFPGLPDDQSAAILKKAGGNARYLDRLIQLLLTSPALFVAREAKGALHADALDEILSEGFDLHGVTRRLFDAAPEEARRAAALASVQGERFLQALVEEVATALNLPQISDGLTYCASPLAVLGETANGIGEFSQGIFLEVARSLVTRTVDRESVVKRAHADLCRRRLDNWYEDRLRQHPDPVCDLLLLDLVIGLAENDRKSGPLYELSIRAMLRKGEWLLKLGDLAGARRIMEALDPTDLLQMYDAGADFSDIYLLAAWYCYWSEWETAKEFLKSMAAVTRRRAEELDTLDFRRDLAVSESKLGDVVLQLEGPAGALPYYTRSQELWQVLATELDTPDVRRDLAVSESKLGDAALQLEGPAAALPYYRRGWELWQALATELDTRSARHDLAASESMLGNTVLQLEGPAAARPYYARSQELSQALATELDTQSARHDLAVSESKLGDVVLQLEGPAAARPYYARSRELWQALATELNTPSARRVLAASESKLGDVVLQLEGPAAARSYYARSGELAQALATELDTPSARRDLATSESRLGDVVLQLEDPAAARSYYARSQELWQALATELDTPSARRDLATSESRLGDVVLQLEGPAAAQPYYARSRELAQALATELDTPSARHDLAVSESKLGDVVLQLEGPAAARPYYARSRELSLALATELDTPSARHDLAVSESNLGDVVLQLEGPAAAQPYYARSQELSLALATELDTPSAWRVLAASESRLGDVVLQLEGPAEARPFFERALAGLERLADLIQSPNSMREVEIMRKNLASLAVSPALEQVEKPSSRNSPCPCGSGKRYKHCHGLIE